MATYRGKVVAARSIREVREKLERRVAEVNCTNCEYLSGVTEPALARPQASNTRKCTPSLVRPGTFARFLCQRLSTSSSSSRQRHTPASASSQAEETQRLICFLDDLRGHVLPFPNYHVTYLPQSYTRICLSRGGISCLLEAALRCASTSSVVEGQL